MHPRAYDLTMDRIFEHLPTEALEGLLLQNEEALQQIRLQAQAELSRRLASIAMANEREECIADAREQLMTLYEHNDSGVTDAFAEDEWIIRGSN